MNRPIRIAGVSGALGDDFTAFGRAVRGEPVDVIIGDYLAEVTMGGIAANYVGPQFAGKLQDFYCDVFIRQIEPELPTIAERGVRIVVNAGAFAPLALAHALRRRIESAGVSLKVAAVHGDDMVAQVPTLAKAGRLASFDGRPMPVDPGKFLAANAYLGGWGIAAALVQGSDIVICGRVADASLVTGAAAWWHGWEREAWNELAGALAAGHIIECGSQALGGNFSGFLDHPRPIRLGYPIAEVAADGNFVITKAKDEAGHVTADTVTAQLVYEIQGARYLNPDVILHVDSVRIAEEAENRVRIDRVQGSPPPATTKLSCYWHHGYRQIFHSYVSGRSIEDKVEWLERQLAPVAAGLPLDAYSFEVLGCVAKEPSNLASATTAVRIAAAASEEKTLQQFLGAYFSINLGSFPGIHGDYGAIQPRIEFWPGLLAQALVPHAVTLDDGQTIAIAPPATHSALASAEVAMRTPESEPYQGPTQTLALGDLLHARSGDKGANANLGVWCREQEAWQWLQSFLDEERLTQLLALPEGVTVVRHELPNIKALLFVLHDYFGESGTGNIGLDQIGKSIGEFLLAREVEVPAALASVVAARGAEGISQCP